MTKKILPFMALLLLCAFAGGCAQPRKTLNILNWGEYMDETLVQEFSREYGVDVNYNTIDSNEKMYAVVSTEGSTVDILIPSDFMIERLIREDRLREIDKANIPNFKHVGDSFLDKSFDPGNKYSIPYAWGTLGILYNKNLVREPVTGWSILWDEKYADNIYMYDSMRDALAVALLKLGYSINSRDPEEIRAAGEELLVQKKLVKAYGTDDIKSSILLGSGALGVVYSGDAMVAMSEDIDGVIGYAVPEEGSNIWFDNFVIMKNAKNPDIAESFINFMLDPEHARVNSEAIEYPTPVLPALEGVSEDLKSNPAYAPSLDIIGRCDVFEDITADKAVKELYEEVWNRIKAE